MIPPLGHQRDTSPLYRWITRALSFSFWRNNRISNNIVGKIRSTRVSITPLLKTGQVLEARAQEEAQAWVLYGTQAAALTSP
jgi:hypothetical protein